MSKKHVLFVVTALLELSLMILISGCIGEEKSTNETTSGDKVEIALEQQTTTSTVITKWKSDKADSDLVKVVNFLINSKGKVIELAGEKYKITGKEEIATIVKVPGCCETMFNQGLEAVSTCGKVKSSNLDSASVYAMIPAKRIPEMEASSLISGVNFVPKAKDYWMQVLEKK